MVESCCRSLSIGGCFSVCLRFYACCGVIADKCPWGYFDVVDLRRRFFVGFFEMELGARGAVISFVEVIFSLLLYLQGSASPTHLLL